MDESSKAAKTLLTRPVGARRNGGGDRARVPILVKPMIRRSLPFLSLLAAACGPAEAAEPPPSAGERSVPEEVRTTRVEVATVHPSMAALDTRWPGEVVGSEDALLASAMGGFIERVLVEEGDEVRSGQVLVRVDTATAGARTAQARVEVDAAQRELERAERMTGAISEQQLDNARSRLAAARAALRAANVMSARSVIRAPFAGTIAQVEAERGEVAAPGAPLVRLVKLNPVHVSLAVPDRDVVALEPGLPVRVRVDAAAVPIEGRIERISPAANLQTRAFEVRVEVDNADRRLLPGMIAQVQADGEATQEAIVLPQHVLVTGLENNGVFVDDDGVARWQQVRAGRVMRNQVVIESGVSAGDRIVVTGHRELADGDAITVVREGTCCDAGRIQFGSAEADPLAEPTGAEGEAP